MRLRALPGPDGRRRPRWGLRTMGFLILAIIALLMSQISDGGYTWGQLGSFVLGLGGAAYCSARGIYAALQNGLLPRRPPYQPPPPT